MTHTTMRLLLEGALGVCLLAAGGKRLQSVFNSIVLSEKVLRAINTFHRLHCSVIVLADATCTELWQAVGKIDAASFCYI